MRQRFLVPCGRREAELLVPAGVPVELVRSHELPPVPCVAEAIRDALAHPIGSPRLSELVRPGQKVAIIVTDITRKLPEEEILPALLEELGRAGIPDRDVVVVVATGTHRPNTGEELVEKFGRAMVERFRFVNHRAFDQATLKHLGRSQSGIPLVTNREVAEADVRISTGVIETHLFAGYSGGVKSVAVGVAGAETIAATHNFGMLKETRLGVTEGNRFRDFLTEATDAVGLDFIVNVVQTGHKEVVQVVAGHPVEAWKVGVGTARAMYEVPMEAPADIVVAGALYPKSRDLYQASRAVNTSVFGPRPVVKQGGVLLVPAPCEDGFGHPGYVEWMARAGSPEEIIRQAEEEGFAPGDQKALILAWVLRRARLVITDCAIPAADLRRIHLEAAPTLQEAFDRELAACPGARVAVIPDALLTLPVLSHS
ncbi:MAG: nickel-dependent lactate racemase [Chitinophagales bacterium]